MGCACKLDGRRWLFLLIAIVQVALACAVLGTVGTKLANGRNWIYSYYYGDLEYYGVDSTCLMTASGYDVCSYSYAVGALSILLSLILGSLQVLGGRGRGVAIGEIVLSCFGTTWWLVFGAVVTYFAIEAGTFEIDRASERSAVVALAWVQTLLFLGTAIASCIHGCAACCCYKAPASASAQAFAPQGPLPYAVPYPYGPPPHVPPTAGSPSLPHPLPPAPWSYPPQHPGSFYFAPSPAIIPQQLPNWGQPAAGLPPNGSAAPFPGFHGSPMQPTPLPQPATGTPYYPGAMVTVSTNPPPAKKE